MKKEELDKIIDEILCTSQGFMDIVEISTKLSDEELSRVADAYLGSCTIEGKSEQKKPKKSSKTFGGQSWSTFLEQCRDDEKLTGTDRIIRGGTICSPKWKEWKEKHPEDK